MWLPGVITFSDNGMFEANGALVTAPGGCDVLFEGDYFEAVPISTVTAPAHNVTWTNCRGTGTGQQWFGFGVWNCTN